MRVFKLKITNEAKDVIPVRCFVDNDILIDVQIDGGQATPSINDKNLSVLGRLDVPQRTFVVDKLTSYIGRPILVTNVSTAKVQRLIEAVRNKPAEDVDGEYTKPEECAHRLMTVTLHITGRDIRHVIPTQLRCMNCGATYIRCLQQCGSFHRLGEDCTNA